MDAENVMMTPILLSPEPQPQSSPTAVQQHEIASHHYEAPRHIAESLGTKALKASIIAFEMLPVDDAARYTLTAAALTYNGSPVVGAAVLGGVTLVTETAAVMASAKWVAQDRIGGVINAANIRIDSFKTKLNEHFPKLRPGRFIPSPGLSKEWTLPVGAQALVALNMGSVALMELRQRANPERTASVNRREGMVSAALVSGYMAVEGALYGTGASHITNPAYLSLAAAGIGGIEYGLHKLRKTIKKGSQ